MIFFIQRGRPEFCKTKFFGLSGWLARPVPSAQSTGAAAAIIVRMTQVPP